MTTPRKIGNLDDSPGKTVAARAFRSRSYDRSFYIVFQNETVELARTISTASTLKLMLWLPTVLSYTTFKRLPQVEAGRTIRIAGGSFSRAINELVDAGFVERKGSGPIVEWRLNPEFGWRGTRDAWHKAMIERGKIPPDPPN